MNKQNIFKSLNHTKVREQKNKGQKEKDYLSYLERIIVYNG